MQFVPQGLQLAKQTMAQSNLFSLVGITKIWIEKIPHTETIFFCILRNILVKGKILVVFNAN